MDQKGVLFERSEFHSFPIFEPNFSGFPKYRGRLFWVTFFGETKKVTSRRATPDPKQKNNQASNLFKNQQTISAPLPRKNNLHFPPNNLKIPLNSNFPKETPNLNPQSKETKLNLKHLALCALLAAASLIALPTQAQQTASNTSTTNSFQIDGMDTSVKPGNDFNAYANGGWQKKAVIPADQSGWGIFGEINERTNKQLDALIQTATQAAPGSEERKVGDYYS